MDLLGIHHVAIRVTNLEQAGGFYREVLGLPELARHKSRDGTDRSIWLELPGGGFLALEKWTGPILLASNRSNHSGYCALAFRIRRAQRLAIVQELSSKGASVVHQTQWTLYIQDPEGNRIGLSHHPEDFPAHP